MKKILGMILILLFIIAYQIVFDYNMSPPAREYLMTNAGELQHALKPYEKNYLFNNYIKLMDLQRAREESGVILPSGEEQRLRKELNQQLNKMTRKYLYKEEDYAVSSPEAGAYLDQEQIRNQLMERLSSLISQGDYSNLKKQVEDYLTTWDYEHMNEANKILVKYPNLPAGLIIQQLIEPVEMMAFFEIKEDLELEPLDIYPVATGAPTPEENLQYNELWQDIKKALTPEMIQQIHHFLVYTDGEEETLAFVNYFDQEGINWYMAADMRDSYEGANLQKDFYFTVVHEYGHILTLSEEQVQFDGTPHYGVFFEEEITAKENSYINKFYTRFWKDLYEDGMAASVDEENIFLFYLRHENDFVTDYAATSVSEDICESFAYFVIEDKPEGSEIWMEKVRFFYEFSELVNMRNEIRSNLDLDTL